MLRTKPGVNPRRAQLATRPKSTVAAVVAKEKPALDDGDSATSSYKAAVRARALELVKLEQDARALASTWTPDRRVSLSESAAVSQDVGFARRHGAAPTQCSTCACRDSTCCCRRRCSRSPSPRRRCYDSCPPYSAYALRGVLARPVSPVFIPSFAPAVLPLPFAAYTPSPVLFGPPPPLYRGGFCEC